MVVVRVRVGDYKRMKMQVVGRLGVWNERMPVESLFISLTVLLLQ